MKITGEIMPIVIVGQIAGVIAPVIFIVGLIAGSIFIADQIAPAVTPEIIANFAPRDFRSI